jgi:2C-methyl-D-erythritol 2,4-cyclodiphosphate synthase
MEERGYVLGNIDCTIIAQKPKLSPHKVGGLHWAHSTGPQ